MTQAPSRREYAGRRLSGREIAEIAERHNISDLAARTRKIVRQGREFMALCAFHSERSGSMRLNDQKGTFHCFGCGKSGDIVTYVMETEGLGFVDALRWLGAADLPHVDPALRARAAAEDAAERAAAIAEAAAIWKRCSPAAGTPAEVYARSRGITMPLPPSIRFGMVYPWRDKETGELGPDLPALIGAVTNAAGAVVAIQRIFLRDGGRAKANMEKPKLSLGRVKGAALRLDQHHAGSVAEVVITEGPEDGLSLAQEMPDQRIWVALGTAMMPEIAYPPELRSIVIAGQNDSAGRAAVAKAEASLRSRGFEVRLMWPAAGFKDWNDQLRGIRS